MAIEFARPRFIQRSKGHNVVQVAAYNMRDRLYCERTGERTPIQDPSTLVHHEIMLPSAGNTRFAEAGTLWNAAQAAERRKDSQEALEIVLSLPANREITGDDRIALARSFAQEHFVSRGLAVQLDIHTPHSSSRDPETVNHHAHLLITTRRIEGNQLAAHKAADLMPKVRRLPFGKRIVAEGELWGTLWRDHQNAYFGRHDKGITVDPVAPIPAEHIGPIRFRHPKDHRLQTAEQIRQLNAKIARDPQAVAEHLGQRPFDGRALSRFLTKHIADPEERAEVQAAAQDKLRDLQRDALEKAAWADKVPSGLRPLSIEDVARELSPAYAALIKRATVLREEARSTDWVRNRQDADKEASVHRVDERWHEMGIARRVFHLVGARRDLELERWSNLGKRADYTIQKWSIRGAAIIGELNVIDRQAASELQRIRPAAERELINRQKIARNARAVLENLDQRDKLTARRRRSYSRGPPL